jgi:hypothetical protein
MKSVPVRLFVILARRKPVGVVFRRGPSKWVRLIRWDTSTDHFQPGQWFHGRIYERRCDLSPDGSLMVYFAQKITRRTLADQKGYTYAWTAVSKPPWLSALTLWPKGDSWHGGGLFEDQRHLWLNHLPDRSEPHPNHVPPSNKLKVIPNPQAGGEDHPVFFRRLKRDGWEFEGNVVVKRSKKGSVLTTHDLWTKRHAVLNHTLQMTAVATIEDRKSGQGAYFEKYCLVPDGSAALDLQDASWADWDRSGRLLLAREGCLFEVDVRPDGRVREQQLIDLNNDRPEPVRAPQEANRW